MDPRKPDVVISLVTRGDVRHRFELFKSSQFKNRDMLLQRRTDDRDTETVRVRHNGVWTPPGTRTLLTLDETLQLVDKVVRRSLGDE